MKRKPIVCKFGGTSMADAGRIRKVVEIFRSDPRRTHIVVSAPGKRHPKDEKVTDLLYAWHRGRNDPSVVEGIYQRLLERFGDIFAGLGFRYADLSEALDQYRAELFLHDTPDLTASRGEELSAMVMTAALNGRMVGGSFIRFDARDRLDMAATEAAARQLGLADMTRCVIPGFYGTRPDGSVKTFSRGGSDLSGAVVAAVVDAQVYENWTDVDGIYLANPKVVPEAAKIDVVTFHEIRELSYNGAEVLHEEVVFPLYKKGIPIHVRNTNRPHVAGTMVVPDDPPPAARSGAIAGIAGRKDFTVISLKKTLLSAEKRDVIAQICAIFARYGVQLEGIPSGLDSISVTVPAKSVHGKLDALLLELTEQCRPDELKVFPNVALICVVGHAMDHAKGVAAKVFQAVRDADVNVKTISQCVTEHSIIVGVEDDDCERAIRAIYRAFSPQA